MKENTTGNESGRSRNHRGILRMEINGGCPAKVIFEPVNGTAWLHRAELAALFGVTAQTVNACMDALFKENLADRQEACKYDLYVSGNRIRHDVREVRLDAVIAMAFRIGSPQAKILREWFIDRCLNYGLCGILPVDMENFRMN